VSELESMRHVDDVLSLQASHYSRLGFAPRGELRKSRHLSDAIISETECECHGEVLG
jgi:hypothetical protein